MLEALQGWQGAGTPTLLDVGCGWGGLLGHAHARGIEIDYTGIDVCEPMVAEGAARHPEATFLASDVFALTTSRRYDVVVCNGILTQKLDATIAEMDRFSARLIPRLFDLAQHAAAFNVMTTRVNFMAANLYYRSPVEMLAFCMESVTPRVRIDHSYPLYEYTVYLLRGDDAPGTV